MVTTQTNSIQGIVDHIFTVRRISRTTQRHLMNLLLNQSQLTPQEQDCVHQISDALRRGMLRVVD